MEEKILTHYEVVRLLKIVLGETIESDKRTAIKIAIGAVNTIQRALKWNEHERRQNEDEVYLS